MEEPTSAETVDVEAKTPYCSVKGCISKLCRRSVWVSVGLGQTLSVLICGTAVTSGLLQQHGVEIPTAQSFANYALLCLLYTTWLACRRGDGNIFHILRHRGWKYFLLAVIDVEANYLIVKAYHFTTVTSVQLLDCFTIPTVLFLSWLFLRVHYRWMHILGVSVCLLGVGALVLADFLVGKNMGGGNNKILGDMLCLAGATLYGVSNVGQEYVVRSYDRVEYLGMIGMFGCVINGIQFAVLERKEVANIDFTSIPIVLSLVGYALCLFFLYSLMPVVISITSATSVNLNLLSADFYALIVGLLVFHYQFHALYLLSFGLIIIGLIVYSICPPNAAPSDGSRTSYTEMAVDDAENELQYDQEGDRLCENTTVSYQRTKTVQHPSGADNHCGHYGRLTLNSSTKEEDEEQLMMAQETMAQEDIEDLADFRRQAVLSDIPEESDAESPTKA